MQAYTLIHLLIFVPSFPLGRVAGAEALGGPGIPHDQQQSQIVLLATHQDGIKQGRRCTVVTPVPSPRGALVGLAPPKKLQAPQIEILNTIN